MSYTWGSYASPTSCTPKLALGATSLAAYLKDALPYTFSMGICNCRSVRGGSTFSHHANCRAYDCGIATNGGAFRPELGNPIHELLGPFGKRLGLDHLILNRIIYSARSPNGREYKGVHPHYNHAHIGLTAAAGLNLNYASIVAILGLPVGVPIGEDAMLPLLPNSPTEDIRSLQGRLNTGFAAGLVEDAVWGPLTSAAVKAHLLDFTGADEAGDAAVKAGEKVNARMWNGLFYAIIVKLAPEGPKGDKGDKGATGSKGATGARGAKGASGTPGANGSDGADGADGKTGSRGAVGAVGAEGATGSEGPEGPPGKGLEVGQEIEFGTTGKVL